MEFQQVEEFAARYTAAWCAHEPASVAQFYTSDGSLTINDKTPAVGRARISEAVQAFLQDLPDLVVEMDGLRYKNGKFQYLWTLSGTSSPGGRSVRISGYEQWCLSEDGLIRESAGYYDESEYARQSASQPEQPGS